MVSLMNLVFRGEIGKRHKKKSFGWLAFAESVAKGFSGKIACFTHREAAARATQIDTIASCTER